jgi:hypothetical protein
MKKLIATIVTVYALAGSAHAHELQSNRATLVLRDRQHVSLTFFIDYVSVLHRTLAPQQPLQEFVLIHSAMPPQALKAQLQEAHRRLQASTRLTLSTGKNATLTQWAWPKAERVQKMLQAHAMEAVVAAAVPAPQHVHAQEEDADDQVEIRAEAQSSSPNDFTSVTLQLPAQFQNVLVVSYQPKQVWVKPGAASAAIRF